MSTKIITQTAKETQKTAEILAEEILKMPSRKKAVVLALIGNLGGGKTTFLQGFAKGLGIKEKINSPTFVIMKRFNLACRQAGNFYHFDCYRTQKAKDILDLGFQEIISNPKNIVAIEWADRIKSLLPKDRIMIHFELIGKNKKIIFTE